MSGCWLCKYMLSVLSLIDTYPQVPIENPGHYYTGGSGRDIIQPPGKKRPCNLKGTCKTALLLSSISDQCNAGGFLFKKNPRHPLPRLLVMPVVRMASSLSYLYQTTLKFQEFIFIWTVQYVYQTVLGITVRYAKYFTLLSLPSLSHTHTHLFSLSLGIQSHGISETPSPVHVCTVAEQA